MTGIHVRQEGRAGRITLDRPEALNALTYDMVLRIEEALDLWEDHAEIALVLIDAVGDKAFCAGGDLQAMYDTARRGDFDYGRRFWQDEYRLNARIATYTKPYVAFMQGFTMGGGVGISCHGSHRIVGEGSRIAMPECGIGLIPDVGGSLILARAPGRIGEYLGMTGARMDGADAIHAGFADHLIPQTGWEDLKRKLIDTGETAAIAAAARLAPPGTLARQQTAIDAAFGAETAGAIVAALGSDDWAEASRSAIARGCPLSVAATPDLVRRVRALDRIEAALAMEYRFTARSASDGEFIEGIRAMIIDKDRRPRWRHADVAGVTRAEVDAMLAPLGDLDLNLAKGA